MRTQEEIAARLKGIQKDDFLGFGTSALLQFLRFDLAKEYMDNLLTVVVIDEGF